jgi:hypothetical protein
MSTLINDFAGSGRPGRAVSGASFALQFLSLDVRKFRVSGMVDERRDFPFVILAENQLGIIDLQEKSVSDCGKISNAPWSTSLPRACPSKWSPSDGIGELLRRGPAGGR